MQAPIRALLSTAEIFTDFSEGQLTLVAAICAPETHARGAVLLHENEPSDDLYVIGRGGVEVLMNPAAVRAGPPRAPGEPVVLTELRQGQVFGEVALVDQGVRSATVRVSRDDTLLLRLSRDELMRLCETYPLLGYRLMRNLAAELATKIRNTDWIVRQYQLARDDEQAQ
jgi:CRP-like cAMP-binding protein